MSDLDIELMTIATEEMNAGTPDSEIKNILRQAFGPSGFPFSIHDQGWIETQVNAVMNRANRNQ